MKIIADGKAYVQLNDVMYIINHLDNIPVPASVFNTVFKDCQPIICTDSNRYEFIEFDDEEAIKFFRELDYSVDYLAFKDKSEDEIIQEGSKVAEEKNALARKFNQMSDDEKRENQSIVSECEMLEFKIFSIRDIVWMKQGHLKIKLPKTSETKQEKPFDKIKKIFKKR